MAKHGFYTIRIRVPSQPLKVNVIRSLNTSKNKFCMTSEQFEGYYEGGYIWIERDSSEETEFGMELSFINIMRKNRRNQ